MYTPTKTRELDATFGAREKINGTNGFADRNRAEGDPDQPEIDAGGLSMATQLSDDGTVVAGTGADANDGMNVAEMQPAAKSPGTPRVKDDLESRSLEEDAGNDHDLNEDDDEQDGDEEE